MGISKISLAIICVLGLAVLHLSCAQNTQQDYINAHNTARNQAGLGPIKWDANLAAYAQNYANQR